MGLDHSGKAAQLGVPVIWRRDRPQLVLVRRNHFAVYDGAGNVLDPDERDAAGVTDRSGYDRLVACGPVVGHAAYAARDPVCYGAVLRRLLVLHG